MNIRYQLQQNFPSLAWCAALKTGSETAVVQHGDGVDTRDHFFVEGAWDGEFEQGNLYGTSNLMGSGMVFTNDAVVICTPSNTTECVYTVRHGNQRWVSNSLVLLLTTAELSLSYDYLNYENDFLSVSDGLSQHVTAVPTQEGPEVQLLYFHNAVITTALDIEKQTQPKPPSFASYTEFKSYLSQTLEAIAVNASAPTRVDAYHPIVFCSNGYDSVASAVLGKEIGCDEAVVFESKRKSRSDSGSDVVKKLGYSVIHEKNELDYKDKNVTPDFVASGEIGTSIFFAAAEEELQGKMLLSGIHGDKIWDRNCETPNDDIVRSFYPDISKKEFRLRVGYINVAIPFIGVAQHKNLHMISNSSDMESWTLHNDYDRPIPRRIAEEAGVPREWFGMHKSGGAASSLRFMGLSYLQKVMPAHDFRDFKAYYQERKKKRKKSARFFLRSALYTVYCGSEFARKHRVRLFDKVLNISKWDRKYKCSPWAPSFLLLWGNERIQNRYKETN